MRHRKFSVFLSSLLFSISLSPLLGGALEAKPQQSLARFGKPKYPEGFTHVDHVNPNAPKGGELKLGTVDNFDCLSPFIVKGKAAASLMMLFDPLMARNPAEPFTLYGVIAEKVERAEDASSITFYLNPKARFHDGSPILAEDVKFTIELLRDKGLPRYKQYYSRIKEMEIVDERTLRVTFTPEPDGTYDPELPMIIAVARILSKKATEGMDFQFSGLTPLVGSGPYRIENVVPGRSIVYARVEDHWAKDLPIYKGTFNFGKISIEYFKNATSQFQAFCAGEFHFFAESDPHQWAKNYNFKGVKEGKVHLMEAEHKRPVTVSTLIFNMNRPLFQDRRVRKALSLALDFETLNRMLFNSSLKRCQSLFANTKLAHHGKPSAQEKKILQEAKVPAEIMKELGKGPVEVSHSKGNGDQRASLAKADKLLREAGWIVKNGKRVNTEGKVFSFEFMLKDPKLEKIALAYQRSLQHLGIELRIRKMDTSQYETRVVERDFDMIHHLWSNSLSPGNEQAYYFGIAAADRKGSSNYMALKDPSAEALAKKITLAKTYEELTEATHALDRYVSGLYYYIGLSYEPTFRCAYWKDRVAFPNFDPEAGINTMEWGWAPGAKN